MAKPKGIKTVRLSGLPVNTAHIKAYEDDWRSGFDRLQKKHGKDMLSLQEALVDFEESLKKQYGLHAYWDLIKSKKEMIGRVEEYGPIAAAIDQDTGELNYIIIDQGL